jgi:hypothetical protein
VKRGALLLTVFLSVFSAPGFASAKGNIHARGYAVITGPGLSHPIVYSAPWDSALGGYYSGDAEIFLALAENTGALPAGRNLLPGGGSVPAGVLPVSSMPQDRLGPRYRLTWFRDDVIDVARQDLYPYAENGLLVYTLPSSRQALIDLFGRFQAPAHLWTGWGRATFPYGLFTVLRAKGLPKTAPVAAVSTPRTIPAPEVAHGQGTQRTVPTADIVTNASSSRSGSAYVQSAIALLLVLITGSFWLRRSRPQPRRQRPAGLSS